MKRMSRRQLLQGMAALGAAIPAARALAGGSGAGCGHATAMTAAATEAMPIVAYTRESYEMARAGGEPMLLDFYAEW